MLQSFFIMRSIIAIIFFCLVAAVVAFPSDPRPVCSKNVICPVGFKCQTEEATGDCICCPQCAPPGRSDLRCKIPCRKCTFKDE